MTHPDTSLEGLFPAGNEHRVDTADSQVVLVISRYDEGVPTPVAVRCANARGILRFAGGASIADVANQQALLAFARGAFDSGLEDIVLMSGGTRILDDDGRVSLTMLELPWLIRQWNPTCRTLGSVPRTERAFSYRGQHSSFMLGDKLDTNTLPHPGLDLLWVVQHRASETLGLDGDVELYFELMRLLRSEGAAAGLAIWNGGTVTAHEIRLGMEYGIPVLIVRGSGRFADDAINWRDGRRHLVSDRGRPILEQWDINGVEMDFAVVDFDHPEQARPWLRRNGLLHVA